MKMQSVSGFVPCSPARFAWTFRALPAKKRLRTPSQPPSVRGTSVLLSVRNINSNESRPRSIRQKQSLSQTFLHDRNTIARIIQTFSDSREELSPYSRVVEVGPGLGALTNDLFPRYPDMHAIEIDQRAVACLKESHPSLSLVHGDVLDTDWAKLSNSMGAPLAVIGNLPYHIVSQILLSLFEAPAQSVGFAIVMMQHEVAERLVASTRCKSYGILSVVGQLYSQPEILFTIPPTAFHPRPKVKSAIVRLQFSSASNLDVSNLTLSGGLRQTVRSAFGQRRKVLRNSLKALCDERGIVLPDVWGAKRPEELRPEQFIELTKFIYHRELANPEMAGDEESIAVWRSKS